MGFNRPDCYTQPEKFNLRIVGIAFDKLGSEYNMFVVWQDEINGQLYYAADRGCSCNTPFEWAFTLGDLDKAFHPAEIQEELDEWILTTQDASSSAAQLRTVLAGLR